MLGFRRAERERAAVERRGDGAPCAGVDHGGAGWLYPVLTSSGDRYKLFLWFDGSGYQVKVVSPEVEGCDARLPPLPRGAHLPRPGAGGGMATLEGAFAKSVLWANGFSAWRRTGTFPF